MDKKMTKCVINECITNQLTKKTSLSIPTFKLPRITNLKHEWLEATNGTVWNKNSEICIKHFKEDDIIRHFKLRKKSSQSFPLKSPKIRPGAIPSVFNINLKSMEQEEGDIFRYCELENKDSKKAPKIKLETKISVFKSDEKSLPIKAMEQDPTADLNKEVFSKNIGTQCNLIEELWVQRVNKEDSSKKCSCVEEFFKHLKIQIIDNDPLSTNNLNDQMLVNDFAVADLYTDPWKIEKEILDSPSSSPINSPNASPITPISKEEKNDMKDANTSTIAMNTHDSLIFADDDSFNFMQKKKPTDDITDPNTFDDITDPNTYDLPSFSDDDSVESMPDDFLKNIEKQSKAVGFHKHKDGSFECRQCGKNCQNLAGFKAHAGTHSEKSVICFKCGLTFSNNFKMIGHSNKCNYIVETKISNNTAPTKENLSHSLLTMDYENLEFDEDSKKNLDKTCVLCNKFFTSIRKYLDHMNFHSKKKPYKCNSCRSQFSTYSYFLAHAKKYKCSKDGLIQPKYAPKGRVRGEFASENPTTSTKNTVYYKCRICSFVGARDSYTKHFKNNNGHLTAEQNWLAKFNIHEFLCQNCKPEKIIFKNLYECINHSRKKHRKFPDDKFLKWYEENQWMFIGESTNVDHCLICKIGLSEKEFGGHLCTSQHLEKEKLWLDEFNINQLKCHICPEIQPFLKLFDLMMHHIEEHVTNPDQQLTIKDFISNLLNVPITIIMPNDNGDIVTENGQIIPTKDVGGLEYVKEKKWNGKYLCRICKLTFVKRIHYFDHQVKHKGIKPYKCACGTIYQYYEQLLKHSFKDNCSIVGRKMPGYAPKTFQYLGSDSLNDNDNGENITDCTNETKSKHCCICDSDCDEESFMDHFNTEIHLKAEIEWKSSRNNKRIKCRLCGSKFEKIYAFVKHRNEKHKCQLTEDFISTIKYNY